MLPKACDASSIILKLYFFDKLYIFFISQEYPPICTGITTLGKFFFFVFDNFSSNLSTQILFVLISISTKSIFAPACKATLAVETNVFGEVQTLSFFFNPKAKQLK